MGLAGSSPTQLASGMQITVICSEDVPALRRTPIASRLAAPTRAPDQLDALHGAFANVWPHGAGRSATCMRRCTSDVPALLLSGEADPVTAAAPRRARRARPQAPPPPGARGRRPRPARDRLRAASDGAFLDRPDPRAASTPAVSAASRRHRSSSA